MLTSGFRPWLKHVACLGSLMSISVDVSTIPVCWESSTNVLGNIPSRPSSLPLSHSSLITSVTWILSPLTKDNSSGAEPVKSYCAVPTSTELAAAIVDSEMYWIAIELSCVIYLYKCIHIQLFTGVEVNSGRSRWVRACNSHTKPMSRHFYRLLGRVVQSPIKLTQG